MQQHLSGNEIGYKFRARFRRTLLFGMKADTNKYNHNAEEQTEPLPLGLLFF